VFKTIVNAFKVPELRNKLLFILGVVALYRLGCDIPAPGVLAAAVSPAVESNPSLQFLGLFSGGALQRMSLFALGVMPYITASIIMQLLQAAIPKLEKMSKEEAGQRRITQISRYMTIGISAIEAIGLLTLFNQYGALSPVGGISPWVLRIMVVATLVVGAVLVMWMSEIITQKGIGNGMSMMIFASIVSRIPLAFAETFQGTVTKAFGLNLGVWGYRIAVTAIIILIILVVIALIIFIEGGQRRIPVQYAKRIIGRRQYGGNATYIPLKVNGANVVPIIFASAILTIPAQLRAIFPNVAWLASAANFLGQGWGNWAITFVLIVFFAYFYTALVFNPVDISDNMRKQGGFIPGIRPGSQTTKFIETVMNRITLPGALFLGFIAIGTSVVMFYTKNPVAQQLGGTSILIMVGVALETMQQIEAQLKMRRYDGFFE
jgi:preprotein translocase subunit SecY